MMNPHGGATAHANLERMSADADLRAELLAAVARARRNLREQEEISRDLIERRKSRVKKTEDDAHAAGIDLSTAAELVGT